MSNLIQHASILSGLRPLDFTNKETGELVRGFTLNLLRPCKDSKYEGFGYWSYSMTSIGDDAYRLLPELIRASKDLFLHPVIISCEMDFRGKLFRPIPVSLSPGNA